MSAKAVTGNEGTAREAVLRAMQEAAECVSGKKGAPKGPQGTQGIVILPNDMSWSPPKEKKKNKKDEDDDDDDESGSGHSYTGIEIAIDHANLYDWLLEWTKEYGIPGITLGGVFNTLCLDGTMDE